MAKTILIFVSNYLPGYKAGGPVRTVKNLCDRLGDDYNFKILTRDRDLNDTKSYPGISYDEWTRIGKAEVKYVAPGGFSNKLITESLEGVDAVLVMGAFYDFALKVMMLNKKGRIKVPVYMAGIGLLCPGALKIKKLKKKLYLTGLKIMKYAENITWVASSEGERNDILNEMGKNAHVKIACDLPRIFNPELVGKRKPKEANELRIVFLSRISSEKNLSFAIETVSKLENDISFEIAGPVGNEEYWESCINRLYSLNENIKWHYVGMIDSENVVNFLKDFDVFLLPTLSENFGHVICEALFAGLVPVISNNTMWTDMLKKNDAGFAIPLEDSSAYVETLNRLALMDEDQFSKLRNNCIEFARKYDAGIDAAQYRELFG